MPEKGLTKKEDVKDAVELCRSLNVSYKINTLITNYLITSFYFFLGDI